MAGHLAFKLTVWRRLSWSRAAALIVLALLGLLAPHVSALVLSACAAATVLAVAVADYIDKRAESGGPEGAGPGGGGPAEGRFAA